MLDAHDCDAIAIIMRFDSLRELTTSLQAEARKLNHLGISRLLAALYQIPTNDVQKLPFSLFTATYYASFVGQQNS